LTASGLQCGGGNRQHEDSDRDEASIESATDLLVTQAMKLQSGTIDASQK
jgi:hypothetical protein